MFGSIVLLAMGAFMGANAMANLGTTCDVYEQEEIVGLLCTKGGDNGKCNDYCKGKFGGELIAAECSAERPHNRGRECICRLKCCNQGCYGDPHCWTCDGTKFGYQGLKKHYLLKPKTEYKTLPYFVVSQTNQVWLKGPMAYLETQDVYIKDWKLLVEVKGPVYNEAGQPINLQFLLKINDEAQTIPYRWSKLEGHRERFLSVVWGDDKKTQVVLTTSFGLRIVYAQDSATMAIDTPRHPELKGRMEGLIGRWNDDPSDDGVDAHGVKQPLDDAFSWAFGDSWIVPGGRTRTADCVRDESIKSKNVQVERIDPKIKQLAEKMCKDALEDAELQNCAKKLNRAVPMIKNCIVDVIFQVDDEARKHYVDSLIESFKETCKRRARTQRSSSELGVPRGKPCPTPTLIPLYRLWSGAYNNHAFSIEIGHFLDAILKPDHYIFNGIPGYVATNPRGCGDKKLTPIYYVYRPQKGKEDHLYTQSINEVETAVKNLGYVRGDVVFYCSSAPDPECGATVPLQRYLRQGAHHFYGSLDEGNKYIIEPKFGTHEGVLCHIWATPSSKIEQPPAQ